MKALASGVSLRSCFFNVRLRPMYDIFIDRSAQKCPNQQFVRRIPKLGATFKTQHLLNLLLPLVAIRFNPTTLP